MIHWASAYIGSPWIAGDSDCWSFARRVWRERFGLDVASVAANSIDPRAVRRAFAAGQAGWQAVVNPREGDGVLMARGQWPCHVGVWIAPVEGAGVLHSVEGAGVVFTPPVQLGRIGYRIIGFYRRQI